MDTQSLVGKTALVTGASRNIGRTIAMRLAAAGADIVVNTLSDRDAAEGVAREIKGLGRNSLVGTTLRRAGLPVHLAADEHHQTCDGAKVYIATVVAEGC